MGKVKIDYDSKVNQDIKGKFVSREVYTCFSYEMEAVLRAGQEGKNKEYPLPTYDDIDNLYEYKCPECGSGYQEEEDAKQCCATEEQLENEDFKNDSIEQDPQEIFEWWIVSNYLYEKLKKKGCPVLEWGNNHYWGRCTTGQAILLDGAISEICKDMEILEGQKYDWDKTQTL